MSRKTKQAEIEMRRKAVAANLTAGLTYRDMAEVLDVSLATIAGDVKIIVGRWQREQVANIDDWIQIELHRLDRLLNGLWTTASDGQLDAIDRVLKIMERRARLLGLDKRVAQSIELAGADGGPLVIRWDDGND